MRRTEMMTAGGVTLAGLGALVGLAIGSGAGAPKALAPRAQPIEVRTEVIRKTVNVYRREHPHRVTGAGPGGRGSAGPSAPGSVGALSVSTRTRASGAHAVVPTASAAPVATRSSGSHSTSGSTSGGRSSSGGSGSHTVKTRASGGGSSGGGAAGGPGASRPVSTRSSGGGGERGDHGGGHDD